MTMAVCAVSSELLSLVGWGGGKGGINDISEGKIEREIQERMEGGGGGGGGGGVPCVSC
jgi:hypothetical protein